MAERIRVRRDGDLDLVFEGELIGEGESGSGGEYRKDWTRGVRVRIYRTRGGSYVWSRLYWSRWQGESGRCEGGKAADGEELLQALRSEDGELLEAEKEALEDAAETWPGLAGWDVEDVA